jgi:hypothetical protein
MCAIYLRPISNVECSVGGNLELRQTIEDKILVLFDHSWKQMVLV